jgi:uncharacterized membrane protein
MSVHHVYALFDDSDTAAAAYLEVQKRGCGPEQCSVIMQRDLLDPEQLTVAETAAREGAKKGSLVVGAAGAVLGGLVGLVALPLGLIGLGPVAGALFGAGFGSAYGALSGIISATDEPAEELRKIEAEVAAGKVLIAIETDDPELEQMCDEVFAIHGGSRVS